MPPPGTKEFERMQRVRDRYDKSYKTLNKTEKRQKRNSLPATTYTVQIYLVVDYYAYTKWVDCLLTKDIIFSLVSRTVCLSMHEILICCIDRILTIVNIYFLKFLVFKVLKLLTDTFIFTTISVVRMVCR